MWRAPILIAICIVLSTAAWAWPVHADVSGHARVIDGDTLEISGTRTRLFGIDAPELGQRCQAEGELWICGGLARLRLEERIFGRTVACEKKDRDRYGRIVAVCRADGEDLNAWMVSEGWALAYRQYSQAYVDEEARAKAARLGIWRGEFVPPWDWRRGKRLEGAVRSKGRDAPRSPGRVTSGGTTRATGVGGCRIKGKRQLQPQHAHLPHARRPGTTRAPGLIPQGASDGFCTEAEARAAGWRRAGR